MPLLKSETAVGLAIGLGLAAAAPLVAASLAGASRPLARAAIKSGLIFIEKGREAAAEFGEVMEDLVAEARAEIDQESQSRASGSEVAAVYSAGEDAAVDGVAKKQGAQDEGEQA